MEEIILEAQVRKGIGSREVKDLRHTGLIPAVIYGEGKQTLALQISRHAFLQLMHQKRLENAIIKLKVKGESAAGRACMIKELQQDPVKGEVVHIDFHEISLTKAIKVNVPVVTKGDSIGVKLDGGSLEHILWEIEVECLPTDIPKHIEVDVSNLKIGDSIHIKDITFPEKVKVLVEPEAVVLSVAAPMKEEVVVPVEGEEAKTEPEVIKEKKPEAVEGEAKEKDKDKAKDKDKEKK